MAKYVELYFDAEKNQKWGITVWTVPSKDFDPLTADYENINMDWTTEHEARKCQLALVKAYEILGEIVYVNNYTMNAFFWITPMWIQNLLNPKVSCRIKYDDYNDNYKEAL